MDTLNEATLLILFEKAAEYVRSVAGNLSSDDLLYLYGRFKQVKGGPRAILKELFVIISRNKAVARLFRPSVYPCTSEFQMFESSLLVC